MKKLTKLLALLLTLAMIFSVLAACSSDKDKKNDGGTTTTTPSGGDTGGDPAPDGDKAPSGGSDPAPSGGDKDYTLQIGFMTPNGTHDPNAAGMTNRTQIQTVFQRLFEQDPVTKEMKPWLATSAEYIDDLTLQIKLRDDVYFTDGQHMTSKDVFYCYRDYWAAGFMSSYFECYDWDASEIVDDYTINFKFTKEYGPAVTYLGSWAIYCYEDMPYGDNKSDSDKWFSAPNGTGPYYCVENVASAYVTYQRKDAADYWGELPECEKVTYRYYSESSTMYIDFESGAIDAACAISSQDAERVLAGDCPSFTGYYLNSIRDVLMLILPEETAMFDDIRVREAFFKSVDRTNVALAMYGPLFIDADSILPASVKYYESQKTVDYDPEGAKALLAEAGYPDGISLRLIVTMDMQDLAEALQASLAAGGINISVESYDPGTAIPMLRDMESDFICKQAEGGAYIDEPGLLLDTLSPVSTLPPAGMQDPAWAAAFDEALYNTDSDKRAEGYAKLQEWAANEYRVVPMCERANMLIYNTDKLASFVLNCADEPCPQYAVFN